MALRGPFTLGISVNTATTLHDASDTVFTENNGVAQEWAAIPIWSNSIVFNENSIPTVIAELSQH